MLSVQQLITFRHSTLEDIGKIMPIYEGAKLFMRSKGNYDQWTGGYPSPEVIAADIANNNHYLGFDHDGNVAVVFTFIIGDDPTYAYIEGGNWPDENPYGTIHRIASAGRYPGMFKQVLNYCFDLIDTIRIDTHADNKPMLDAITCAGFTKAGIIYLADGSPRTAFHKTLKL